MSDWWQLANCRGKDPEIFFVTKKTDPTYDEAFGYCEECPVKKECLEWALDMENDSNVSASMMYGAMTPAERISEKRKRKYKEQRDRINKQT